jgi:hypothetical protein
MSYQSLDAVLRQRNQWAIVKAIEKLDPNQQCDHLRELFAIHAKVGDDEGAFAVFQLVMLAITDEELLRYTTGDIETRRVELTRYGHNNQAIDEAEYRAAIKRAETATLLFEQMPTYRREREYVRDTNGDDGQYLNLKHPTLSVTRKAIITEIAAGWKIARDEKTADEFFKFILDAAEASTKLRLDRSDKKEASIFQDVLREATTKGFSTHRLAHAIATFGAENSDSLWPIMVILTYSWARASRSRDLQNAFIVVEQLSDRCSERSSIDPLASSEVVEHVRNVASDVHRLDGILLRATLTALKSGYGGGTTSIVYSNPTTATIVIHEDVDKDKGGAANSAAFDNKRDAIRNALAPFRVDMPPYHVRLRYIGTQRWDSKKILFQYEGAIL